MSGSTLIRIKPMIATKVHAKGIIGTTFTVIKITDVKVGDVLLDFQTINFSHQIPAKITGVKRLNKDFIGLSFIEHCEKTIRHYAVTAIFGKVHEPE